MSITKDRPYYTLGLLVVIYMSNYLDRVVLGIFGQAVKQDLQISDAQLGLLTGGAFAVVYGVMGVPLGRLADRINRRWLLAGCVSLWSVMTLLSGLAANFLALVLMRLGVAVGEAGCTPTAHSLLSDLFPPRRRSMAFGIYAMGPPLGIIVGSIGGGWVAQELGWRAGLMAVGVPGVFLALILLLTTREPVRGQHDGTSPETDAFGSEQIPSFLSAVRIFAADPMFVSVVLGLTGAAIAVYSLSIFTVPFLVRNYELDLRAAAGLFGLSYGAAGVFGSSVGAGITDWAGQRDSRWYAGVPALGFSLGGVLLVSALFQDNHLVFIALFTSGAVLANMALAPALALIQNRVPARTRASASALILMVTSLVGLGLGPTTTGLLSDHFAANIFRGGVFATACPGGFAPVGALASVSIGV
ncbi:MFS transporter [soil metagenome]